MDNPVHVRYPVGYDPKQRARCLGCIWNSGEGIDSLNQNDEPFDYQGKLLDYVESRKQIYLPVYCELVKEQPLFKKLKQRLMQGENLLIIEVDGPHQEDLQYYKDKYGVSDNFIENGTMLVTKDNIQIMLNDTKYAFGHGFCLGMALLDKDKEWI